MNDFKKALTKWDAMSANYQRRIDAQKESIDRLLEARDSEPDDAELLAAFVTERVALQMELAAARAEIDQLKRSK